MGSNWEANSPMSGVLPPIEPNTPGQGACSHSELFGSGAEGFVNELEADRRLPSHAEEIWEPR